MKRLFMCVCLLAMLSAPSFGALQYDQRYYVNNRGYLGAGTYNDPLYRIMGELEDRVAPPGTGSVFYVDSNVTAEGDGTSWEFAKDTLDEAINLCTADNGDWIYVASGHAESGSAANLWDADVAGITIWHCGNAANQGTYTFADTDTTVALGAANVRIVGGRFLAGISAVVVGVSVEAAADDCVLDGLVFPEPTTSSFEFVRAIIVATGADRLTVANCIQYTADAVGATNWVDLDTGVQNGTTIVGNTVIGEFSEGAIHSDDIDLEQYIAYNDIQNLTTGQHAIEFTANATGWLIGNNLYGDTEAAILDPGAMMESGNVLASSAGVDGLPEWVIHQDLDHWMEIACADTTDAVDMTAEVPDDTVLANILDDGGDTSAYDRREDSLVAISDKVDGTTTIAGRTYASTMTATSQSDDLFDVDGGAILITSFTGVVTTEIGAVTNTIQIDLDADAGFIDSDFSTAVETNADVVGTRYVFSDADESVLTPISDTAGNTNSMRQWFCGEGMIEQTAGGATTGAIKWYMTWIPFADGTTVTAQ